ncbi:MAG: hypothetical protein BWK80_01325 [Desulfobacteraceae bacterium IS3]|nr:MAG: hypothetical protein BWK80_01325 [Desulfobacteraceae bacterium IS3]
MIKKIFNKIKEIYNAILEKFQGNVSVLIVLILIQLLFIAYLFNNIVYTVESGEAGVLYKRFGGGTITDKVFAEGLYLLYPWDRLYVYNMRVQQAGHKFHVLTKNGLKVQLSISVRYYPEYNLLGVLHQKVGPDYVNEIVIPEIESVLRLIVGQLDAEEIYTTKTGLIDQAINEAIEQISRRFIKVDDVIIKEVELPDSVADSIRYKVEQKHMAEAHLFKIEKEKREAERKRIEAGGLKDYNNIVNASLTENILQWMGIQATLQLANSDNSKVVVVGAGKRGLPIIGSILLNEELPVNAEAGKKSESAEKAETSASKETGGKTEPAGKTEASEKTETGVTTKPAEKTETSEKTETGKTGGETGTSRKYEFIRDPGEAAPRETEQVQKKDRSEISDKTGMVTEKDRSGMVTEKDRSELTGNTNAPDANR